MESNCISLQKLHRKNYQSEDLAGLELPIDSREHLCRRHDTGRQPYVYFGGQSGILYRIDKPKRQLLVQSFKMFTLAPAVARGGFIGNIEVDPSDPTTIYTGYSNFQYQTTNLED